MSNLDGFASRLRYNISEKWEERNGVVPQARSIVRASARTMPVFAVVGCFFLLACAPSLLSVSLLNGLPHGYINLEFLLIGAAAMFLPRAAVFVLLMIDSLADCAYSVCYTYQFTLSDLFQSIRFLGSLPKSRLLAGGAVLAGVALVCMALTLLKPPPARRLRAASVLLASVAILLPIDVLNGQNSIWHKDISFINQRVARSPVLVLGVREFYAHFFQAKALGASNAPMDSASAPIMSLLDEREKGSEAPNVVLIVVESWGLALDPRLAHGLTEVYGDPAIEQGYRVTFGSAPFTGLTVPGEARELCHSTLGFGILLPSDQTSQNCLPEQLDKRGYQTTAIHGYAGEMFYRSAWYRKLGFSRTLFGPNLREMNMPQCRGAFPGICDGAIAGFIGNELVSPLRDKPQFIYWVTLNSHLPVPVWPDLPADPAAGTQPELRDSAALTSWFRLVRAVHESVSKVAVKAEVRPTIFILVGDHAPPFGDPRLRSLFSGTRVPYVMLVPRGAGAR